MCSLEKLYFCESEHDLIPNRPTYVGVLRTIDSGSGLDRLDDGESPRGCESPASPDSAPSEASADTRLEDSEVENSDPESGPARAFADSAEGNADRGSQTGDRDIFCKKMERV